MFLYFRPSIYLTLKDPIKTTIKIDIKYIGLGLLYSSKLKRFTMPRVWIIHQQSGKLFTQNLW